MLEERGGCSEKLKNAECSLRDISLKAERKNLKRFKLKIVYYLYHDIHQNSGKCVCQ